MFASNNRSTATRPAPAFSAHAIMSYRTACGARIELTERSRQYLEAHPDVLGILPEAIGKLRLPKQPHAEMEVDLGRIVGITSCITTPTISRDDQPEATSMFVGAHDSPTAKRNLLIEQPNSDHF